ncbi:chain-length determining protein [Photobacterium carnosum]|uniref:Wzz/FepE/Etk N-terminal domain-containing protein n=1 Tax=Photobacterium carnosum TaxID=2023717 RepID=UPI001C926F88|nr:Wzz/FepE/Etk N-terminal domain-containing protein [Photobacterium carnosum]MBY3790631.1 chain-length determining protein [Photobacterium carnosum]MCD9535720.1 chain-length determining protein [Photobacterium carnosum]
MNDIQMVNHYRNDDEIDLVQLMKTLWLGKKIIISSIILFLVIATTYALTAQQWWTSSAIVTTGQYRDIAALRQQVANFYVVSNNQDKDKNRVNDKENDNVGELNKLLNNDALLNQYIIEFNAFNNKRDFILSNPIMKEYANIANEKNDSSFVNQWVTKIQASLTNKKEKGVYTLSYQATDSELSHKLLLYYTQFIDNKVQKDVFGGLAAVIKNQTLILKSQLLSLEIQAKELKQQELVKTEYALKIANSAKANKPMPQMNNNQLFSIDLGSEGLSEKSKILKQMTDLSLFEPSILITRTNLGLLSKIKLDKGIKFESISYLQNIGYPITRDKPKRALIIILGSLLGCMLGVAIVLLKSALGK